MSTVNFDTFEEEEIDAVFPIKRSVCVDASCRGNPGPMEYRVFNFETKEFIFQSKVYPLGTNIIGEFLAIVHALAWLNKNKMTDWTIYSDCSAAITWAKNKRTNTGLENSERTRPVWELLIRAVNWINHNHFDPACIRKWKTDEWGEIPADYGRK